MGRIAPAKHHKKNESHKLRKKSAEELGIPNNRIAYIKSLENDETVEYVHCKLHDAHIFKLPSSKPDVGWRALELKQELWQGTVKVLNRDSFAGIILLDRLTETVFAICPIHEVDRCTDSSRYFVVQVETETQGEYCYMGLAFNERGAAFDFNVAMEACMKESRSKTWRTSTPSLAGLEVVTIDSGSELADGGNSIVETIRSMVGCELHSQNPWTLPLLPPTKRQGGFILPPHKSDRKKAKRAPPKKSRAQEAPAKAADEGGEFGTLDQDVAPFGDFHVHFEDPDDDVARVQLDRCAISLCCGA